MKHHIFDNIIKEKALGHESAVPADAWDNIARQKRRRRYPVAWWLTIFLLIGFGYGVYRWSLQTGKDSKLADKSIVENKVKIAGDQEFEKSNVQAQAQTNVKEAGKTGHSSQELNANGHDKMNTASSYDHRYIKKGKEGDDDQPVLPVTGNSGHISKSIISQQDRNVKKPVTAALANISGKADKVLPAGDHDVAGTSAAPQHTSKRRKPNKHKSPGDSRDQLVARGKRSGNDKGRTRMTMTAPAPVSDMEEMNEEATLDNTAIALKPNIGDSNKTVISIIVPGINDSIVRKDTINTLTALATALPPAPKKSGFSLEVSAMPFMPIQQNSSLQRIRRITTGPMSRSEYTADDIRTQLDPSFSFTLGARVKTGKRTWLGFGLQYTKIKESIRLSGAEVNTTYSIVKRLNSTGTALVDDTVQTVVTGKRVIHAVNSFDLISIPVYLQYNLVEKRKWSLALNAGLSFSIRSDYRNSIKGELVPTYHSSAKSSGRDNKLTMDIFAGLRISRMFGERFQVFAEPSFQFNMVRFNMPDMINYKYIHRAGIGIGISYNIRYKTAKRR